MNRMGGGLGLIADAEKIGYVVFDSDPSRTTGKPTIPTDFSTNSLRKGNFSIVRLSYVVRETIVDKVVNPRVAKGERVIGIATVEVRKIRSIEFVVEGLHPRRVLRALSVVNRVEEGDYEAHGALWCCEEEMSVTDSQRRKLRSALQQKLPKVFSEIQNI